MKLLLMQTGIGCQQIYFLRFADRFAKLGKYAQSFFCLKLKARVNLPRSLVKSTELILLSLARHLPSNRNIRGGSYGD